MKRILVVAAASLLVLTGCAAHPTAKPFTTHYGESAVTIANHIKGCEDVAHADIGAGGQTGLVSAATCTLDGRKITVDTYTDANAADAMPLVKATKLEQYWAAGEGWTAFETDDSDIQYQLTGDAEELMKIGFAGSAPTPDVSGEHAAAASIAKSLNGHVEHYAG
jgi:hypothetical protein